MGRAKNRRPPAAPPHIKTAAQGLADGWQHLEHQELLKMLRQIKGLPREAAEPIAVAIELCAPMPGPLRKVWGKVRSHWETLKLLLGHFSFDPLTLELALQLESRLEDERIFSVDTYEREGPSGTVILNDAGKVVSNRMWDRQARDRARGEALSRSSTREKNGRRRNFDDLLVLLVAVLRENGLGMANAKSRSTVLKIVSEILDCGWSDDYRLSEARSPEALLVQIKRAIRGSSLAETASVSAKLMQAHEQGRHPEGVWVFRP